ncbi:MAG: prepilin-type N-terminal cleavage/methylation domain-containing protein [Armatimonadetes bacterium]|nr:prepilin-type N-terminal cleavage/methylation domain-containing protein [Armatimonadota bacterium]
MFIHPFTSKYGFSSRRTEGFPASPSVPTRRGGPRAAFTLIELLVVIAIIAILAALLFPVFSRVKATSRNAVCTSNLKQIGMGIQTYAQDWDGIYPIGLDFADTTEEGRSAWTFFPEELNPDAKQIVDDLAKLPNRGGYIDQTLKGYTKTQELWRCPSDTGLQYLVIKEDTGPGSLVHGGLTNGEPAYDVFKMSYGYRTELGIAGWNVDQGKEVSNLVVMADMAGYWHTRHSRTAIDSDKVAEVADVKKWALNVLYGDGHVKYTPWQKYRESWDTVGPVTEWWHERYGRGIF